MTDNVKVEEPKVIGRVEISLLSNGGVNVQGPIGNPILTLEIFGKAISTVATYLANESRSKIVAPKQSDIIIPT
jgi:hypothetical protein